MLHSSARFLILFFLSLTPQARTVAQGYYKIIGDTEQQISSGIIKCRDGGFVTYNTDYLKGYSDRMGSYCKLDSALNIIWHRYLPDYQTWLSVEELSTGEFYIVTSNYQTWQNEVLKTDSAGIPLWRKQYPISTALLNLQMPLSTAIDSNNNLYIVYQPNPLGKGLYSKMDTSGNILWERYLCTDISGIETFEKIRISPDGSAYILTNTNHSYTYYDRSIIKLNLDSTKKWVINFNRYYNEFELLPHQQFVIAGVAENYISPGPIKPLQIIRFDSSAHMLSSILLNCNDYNLYPTAIASVNDTEFQVFGTARNPQGVSRGLLFKITIDTSGNVINSVLYNDTNLSFFSSIQLDYNHSRIPDLLMGVKIIDSIYYGVIIYEPNSSSICIADTLNVYKLSNNYPFQTGFGNLTVGTVNQSIVNLVPNYISSIHSEDVCSLIQVTKENKIENSTAFFPNPVNDKLYLSYNSPDKIGLLIFDINGKIILNATFKSGDVINTTNFASGIYIYQLKNNKYVQLGKFIKY
jgi:hypothetical protein